MFADQRGCMQLLFNYIVWGQYYERAQFRADYRAKFGREPYVNPLAQLRWNLEADLTQERFNTIGAKCEVVLMLR
jgi:hypothetical protein